MKSGRPRSVREPIQVYMAADDRRLLDQLSESTGLSRAEILRRGVRSFAAEQAGGTGPMQVFMKSLRDRKMPADLASEHDSYLAASYSDKHEK